jgi:hypothetical protein
MHISATVRVNDAVQTYQLAPAPSEQRSFDLPDHVRLEVFRDADNGNDVTSCTRLLDTSSSPPQLLHQAKHTAPQQTVREFSYRVCGDHVLFASPSSAPPAPCGS